ncbi:MAG: hypothetical protein ACJAWO_000096 [Halieaceae bacterium]|jgi:hypothetical protein
MRFWVCSGLIVGLFSLGHSQEVKVNWIKTVPLTATIIESDNMGNAYLVNGSSLSKIDMNGRVLEENSSLALGEISSIDASNALKMLVYFRDLSQITYLDNQLASRGDNVSLDVLGYNQITTICRSYNDGVWLFDQTTFELIRLDEQLQPNVQSGNLSQILDFVPDPTYMKEFNNWLYVNDPSQGILVFDWYGSYTKTIPVAGINKFVVRANRLFFIKDRKIQYYHLQTKQFLELHIPNMEYVDFTIFDDKLLLITQNELLIYRINVN